MAAAVEPGPTGIQLDDVDDTEADVEFEWGVHYIHSISGARVRTLAVFGEQFNHFVSWLMF